MTLIKAGFAYLSLIALTCLASPARAELTDAQANRQIDGAINTQYASADIDLAEKSLLGIVERCKGSCSQAVIARAWMYVGIVRGSGRDDVAGATQAFTRAKTADPNVKLDELFATDVVKKVFEQVQVPEGETMPLMEDIRDRAGDEVEVSSIECSLNVTEVETQRPIPISCRVPRGSSSVVLSYRHELSTRWRQITLKPAKGAWQGEIPCSDTAQVGVVGYHVQSLDAQGTPVDSLGDEQDPREFALVFETEQAPPSLPGQPAPKSCRPVKKPAPAGPKLGSYGDACGDTSECQGGLTCEEGKCTSLVTCDSDSECFAGTCEDGVCQVPQDDCDEEEGEECERESRAPANWFGVQGAVDFAMLSGTGVCGLNADAAFSCFGADGLPYGGLPNRNFSGDIEGGFRTATARVMISYERALFSMLSLEARLGFAFGGGPESKESQNGDGSTFRPYHAEGRVKIYFTQVYRDDGRGLDGPSGFVMIGGGMAQVDPMVSVPVGECRIESPPGSIQITPAENACLQSENQVYENVEVDVYKRLGLGMVTAGGGLRWGFGKHVAAVASVNVQVLLPATGLTLSPSLGVMAGF